MAAVTICSDFGAQENKVRHCFHWFPIYLTWSDGTGYYVIFIFWMLNFKPAFSLSSFIFIYLLQFLASHLMQNSWKGCLFLLSPVSILWLFNPLWSDVHANHLSENVFVKTINDFCSAICKNHFSFFFLDKSAAFDIADHFLLDTALQFCFQDTFLYVSPTKLPIFLQSPFLFFLLIPSLLALGHCNSQCFSLSLFSSL